MKVRIPFVLFLLLAVVTSARAAQYAVLAWNDLGMHCYNSDFSNLAILPPYNTLMVQVVEVADPPRIVTSGITVSYSFPDNTSSTDKSNFWQYAKALFGVSLADNVGLTGKGLSGTMDQTGNYFIAEGIPLTEFRDSAPQVAYPYQLAKIVVRSVATGTVLATQTVVAPVSTEMHCDTCHYDGGVEEISTGQVETNILTLHDEENSDEYPSGHTGLLMSRRPVLCAECHASNALGASGQSGVPSLSTAIHEKHADKVQQNINGCYLCHPGPQTKCLRGVMGFQKGMDCVTCHGTMEQISENASPWLNEPRCDASGCHGSGYAQDKALYRQSKGHGGIYCEACHDSPHAIAPSSVSNDSIKFIALQGRAGTLSNCTACHATRPTDSGPHGVEASGRSLPPGILLPLMEKKL